MRNLVLATFAALTLAVGIAPAVPAYAAAFVNNAYQSGQHDNSGYQPGDSAW